MPRNLPSNPLTDLIPAQYRKQVYRIALAVAFVYAIWQLSQGDWKNFLVALAASFVPGLASSNTFSPESDIAVHEAVADEVEYDGHGG